MTTPIAGNKQNNNFACASSFFVHFFAVVARLPSKLPNFTCYGDRYPQDWRNYRKVRNRLNNKVETEGNARRTWKTINNLMSRRQNNQIVKDVKVNGISICNTKEISNAFNEHFSTIGPRPAREIPLTSDEESIYLNNIPENYNKFCFRPTTTSNAFTHLNRLSKTKAAGLDNISARLIRECADIISGPLCDLFNKSLMPCIFPDEWKSARVTPLFKEGESFDFNNYADLSQSFP